MRSLLSINIFRLLIHLKILFIDITFTKIFKFTQKYLFTVYTNTFPCFLSFILDEKSLSFGLTHQSYKFTDFSVFINFYSSFTCFPFSFPSFSHSIFNSKWRIIWQSFCLSLTRRVRSSNSTRLRNLENDETQDKENGNWTIAPKHRTHKTLNLNTKFWTI